jgi:hypothetical protein
MATSVRAGTKPGCLPAASTPPAQDTPPRSAFWPVRIVAGPGYTADMARRHVVAFQATPRFCNCRAGAGSGPEDRRSGTSVSRRPRLPEAGTRWDT